MANTNKILGYILLGVGVLLIVVPLFQTYNIFTGISMPPELFKNSTTAISSDNIQQQFVEKALLSMIPIDSINKSLNFGSWVLLAWTMMFAGSKLAGVGIKLAKD